MFYSQKQTTDGEGRGTARLLVVGLALTLLTGGTLFALHAFGIAPVGIRQRNTELLRLWNDGQYHEALQAAIAILESEPLNAEALTFAGFARFYIGVELAEPAEQEAHLSESIVLLRRAMRVPNAPLAAQRDYVLAKAYYHRGPDYANLAVAYMLESLERGFDAPDSRTYLALSHAALRQHDQSVAWFQQAIRTADPSEIDAIRLRAAESYVELGDYDAARSLLLQAVESLEEDYLVLMARNRLASVLILGDRLGEAEQLLDETIERYPDSADAYYYLGIVYDTTGRPVQARNLWRTAREIDPNHTDALMQLANRRG